MLYQYDCKNASDILSLFARIFKHKRGYTMPHSPEKKRICRWNRYETLLSLRTRLDCVSVSEKTHQLITDGSKRSTHCRRVYTQ